MSKKIVIFGAGNIGELAYYYFTHDTNYQVAGFCIDNEYVKADSFCNLPVCPLEDILEKFPPEKFKVFIALSYKKINEIRKNKYLLLERMGYEFASYVSSKAVILNNNLIGKNAFILENNVIQPFSSIGDNVTLWSGNHIGHHSKIGSHTFISSHTVISGGVEIGEQCFIGVNATLRDHITIGNRVVIGAGVLMLNSADENGVYRAESTHRSKVSSARIGNI